MKKYLLLSLCLALFLGAGNLTAAGLIILEGSDAQTFHGLQPYSDQFLTGFRSFSSAPLLPVLAVGSSPVGAPGGILANIVFSSSIPTLAVLLANYSALYMGSIGGCCDQNDVDILGHEADVAAFVAAGRGLTVENYQGGSAYDSILGFVVDASKVYGYGTVGGGLGCFDGNTWTAGGQAFGLGPAGGAVPSIGCFGHQAYDATYWAAHGFSTQLVQSAPGAVPAGDTYVVITNGGGGLSEATGDIPEPGTAALLSSAAAAIAIYRKRRASAAA